MNREVPGTTEGLPRSLSRLRAHFGALSDDTLPGDGLGAVTGTYRAVFVGPVLLRRVAPRAIAFGGMPGWYGKRFDGAGRGINLLHSTDGTAREVLPMRVAVAESWLDGRPALTVSYGDHAPMPWRWVRDEVRMLDETRLLGLTYVGTPLSRMVATPFLLVRDGVPGEDT
ncbi:hypothetical protein [Rhodococcus chondri]|uniref:Uncharacterized protein n=1 Tax=Rhodococcus chondri TaxID=3065941 RepID=A0ABU7JSF8_9NOCA|nr:hypothetical protein [Rhodococcus sp. CC-R104]MEE2032829.1 hypothetical protein [Rhodococcus sp. CC-R104]